MTRNVKNGLTMDVLNCEQLEYRDNPSGNVAAYVFDNQLVVVGDGNLAGNQVRVHQDVFGNTFVSGLYGTTVNGQQSVLVGVGAPDRVSVQFGGAGPDYVELVSLTAGFIDVFTGEGNDGTVINGVVTNQLMVDQSGGNDGLDIRNVSTLAGVYLSGGAGTDNLYVGPISGQFFYQQYESVQPAG